VERTLRTVLHASGLRGILAGLAAGALALGGLALMVSTGIGESTSFLNVTGRQAGTVSRILSANLASDEILLSMAPERLIGVSSLADDPRVSNVVYEASTRSGKITGHIEQVLAADPGLVVLGAHSADLARQVTEFGIRVMMLSGYESLDWIRAVIRALGRETNSSDRAEALIAEMDRRIRAVADRVDGRPRPVVLSYSESGYVPGAHTTMDEVIRLAGGDNLGGQLGFVGWQILSREQVVWRDPEVILLRSDTAEEADFQRQFMANPAFRGVRAVRDGRVYTIPGRLMVTSSHYIAETVEQVARVLHPEAFADR
jgi:iron complex transport system substrate-binding protein